MQSREVHLLRRLDRHEAHCWSLHGFGNRLGIAIVVLVPLQERLPVLRRDQTNIMSKRCELAADVLSARTGLHADQADRNVYEPPLELTARDLLSQNDRPALIDPDQLR